MNYSRFRDTLSIYLLAGEWRNDTNAQLQQEAGFSANIITRLKRNGYISLESIESICRVMNCGVDDILEFVPEDNGGKENG